MYAPPIYIGSPYRINVANQDGTAIESGDIIVRLRHQAATKYYSAEEDEDQQDAPEGTVNFVFDTTNMITGRYILEVLNADDGEAVGIRDVIKDFCTAEESTMTPGYENGNTEEETAAAEPSPEI